MHMQAHKRAQRSNGLSPVHAACCPAPGRRSSIFPCGKRMSAAMNSGKRADSGCYRMRNVINDRARLGSDPRYARRRNRGPSKPCSREDRACPDATPLIATT